MLDARRCWYAFHSWYAMQGESIETVFVECIDCGKRAEHELPVGEHMTDQAATAYFESKGWSVLPTRCPKHRKQNNA